ncbi:MAG: hypothetical protein JNM20_20230 [Rhizobiales bacterium]|nr:hypothetical protein [Hyphomicrobiales bacterium]
MRWPGHRLALGIALGVLILWLAGMALAIRAARLPHDATGPMIVVFEPGIAREDMLARIVTAGARPIRETWLGFVWVVDGEQPDSSARLLGQGAIGTYRELPVTASLAGCFAFADAKIAEAFAIRP